MSTTPEHDERIAKLIFASVYPHYVTKVEKKGRTKEELHEVGCSASPHYDGHVWSFSSQPH